MEPLPYTPKFRPGDRIRCINPGDNDLVKNQVYTFKQYSEMTTYPLKPCVQIEEPTIESGFFEERFELCKESNFNKLYERLK